VCYLSWTPGAAISREMALKGSSIGLTAQHSGIIATSMSSCSEFSAIAPERFWSKQHAVIIALRKFAVFRRQVLNATMFSVQASCSSA
jgi:hypothetical protein